MANSLKQLLIRNRVLVLILILLLAAAAVILLVVRSRQPEAFEAKPIPVETTNLIQEGDNPAMENGEQRVFIRLSEGQAQPQSATPVPQATGAPLSADQIEQILSRLPAMTEEAGDQQDFKLPLDPIPPPQTGERIKESFPPPPTSQQPEIVEAGPLEVLRFAPEGEIPLAPFVSLTFNQPMVPLGTISQLTAEQVPARLEPELPGAWRWVGAKTLTFEYDSELIDRLPKATVYRVSVPAGTKSAVGGVLAEAVEWTFSTPPPKMITAYPKDAPQGADPLFFIAFDQRIDPSAVLGTIRVSAGYRTVELKLADEADIQADNQAASLAKNTREGRWLAFRAAEPLPLDTLISVTVGPGTPSAEGPLLTQEAQSYSFHTYAPLRIVEHGCAWSGEPCQPLTPFYIRFNNPIDPSAYREEMLAISPEVPGVVVNIFGDTINIQGATSGQTTYTVIVKADLQDVFGQKLGKDESLSFRVGKANPVLSGPNQLMVTIDPTASEPIFSVYAMNYPRLGVKIYRVQPSDWPAYKRYLTNYYNTDRPPAIPGRLVLDKNIPVVAPADSLTEVDISLKEVMDGDYGHFIVQVAPPKGLLKPREYWRTIHAWVQVTQIGLDALADHSEMIVWTTALQNGAPLAQVSIQAGSSTALASTDASGVARFPIPEGAAYIVASQGADQALLPSSTYLWDETTFSKRLVTDELRWYVFDDRQMYRPGEEVHIKGWIRRIGGGQSGDVGLPGSELSGVSYRIMDPQGNDLGGNRASVNALGGFDFTFTLPQQVNLGYAQLNLLAEGSLSGLSGLQHYHRFQIQEFRRPEFEVTARNETPDPYFAQEHAVVAVEAKYYAGDPLTNAEVTWRVSSSPSQYSPPNWSDFTFGAWNPWWYPSARVFESFGEFPGSGETLYETFTGLTDATGAHYLRLDFEQTAGPQPLSVLAEATVMDVNRQAWAGTTTLLVHPANIYVGMRSERYFVQRGTPLKIDLIVTDIDGNPVTDRPVTVRAARMVWKFSGNDWREEEADVQECRIGSTTEPVTCTFDTPIGGSYRITAQVADDLGRVNQSRFDRWVSGGQMPPARKVEQESVTLIPDQESYQPGDAAQILVQSPFNPAEGLLTVSRSGMLYTQRFSITDGSATLEIPIQDQHIPNLNVQVDLVGAAPRSDDRGEALPDVPPRPAFASGQLTLKIPPLQRTLSLQVIPAETELEPGGETTLQVNVTDAGGQPVAGAEMAVVVVDEAILALSSYSLADPLNIFYAERAADLLSYYSRASIILTNPQELANAARQDAAQTVAVERAVMEAPAAAAPPPMPTMASSAEAKGASEAPVPIQMRTDFNPLAVFAPAVTTGADGRAQVAIKLPDNLTRYRVMAVAVDAGRQFGMGEANLVARLPLMVRPSAPRFLNFGDQIELPVLLQNQTDDELLVDVVVQGSNILLNENPGLRLSVPARNRVEVRFPVAADKAGIARLQIAAVATSPAGEYADAAAIELPVYTPATTEAFAAYGVLDQGAIAQPVAAPSGVFPQYGGLEISTSSTAIQALTDAVLYLVSYPFECSEQVTSRLLAVAALRDVLSAFQAEGLPSPQELEAAVQRDIQRLQGMQNPDGGFPYWRRGQESIPFNSIHAAYALQKAKDKGFVVPPDMLPRVVEHLRQIESYYPAWYSQQTRQTLSAYALFVRSLMGDRDPEKALRLMGEHGTPEQAVQQMSLDALGWLWPVLQDHPPAAEALEAIRRHVNNQVVETAGAANFTTEYDDQNYLLLGSNRRTDAILLDALISDNPEYDLIPKVVNGLLAHRTRGRWSSTQENVFVLLAMDRYFNTFESQTPDFIARIWLGDTYAGEHSFSGRTTEQHETRIPMAYITDQAVGETQDLILSKEGPGRLYYRLGLRYAPADLELDPLDMGFVVQRSYEAVDDPADVSRDADGVWHIRSGARVRVRLTMVAENRRYHVALADPLPAGLEIVNPALAVSGATPQDPSSPDYRYGWWWWSTWYDHQNMRDERAEAFTPLLWEGVYQYTYIARATTPGRFVVPPAKAEEMYSPDVFGRSGSDTVVVR